MSELLKTISENAMAAGVTEIEIISTMQSQCVKNNDMKTLNLLCKIKSKYIKKIIFPKSGN